MYLYIFIYMHAYIVTSIHLDDSVSFPCHHDQFCFFYHTLYPLFSTKLSYINIVIVRILRLILIQTLSIFLSDLRRSVR
jgi:hypothetical protein